MANAPEHSPSHVLGSLLDRVPVAGFFFDATGRLLHANEPARELLGHDSVGLHARSLTELFAPDREGSGFTLRTSVPTPEVFRSAPLHPSRDGVEGTLLFAGASSSSDGDVLEAMARLAGGVAHDFNNHVTAVLGHAQLASRASSGDQVAQHLGCIEQAAERIRLLTQQLLAFSRQQVTRTRDLDVNESLGQSAGAIRAALGAGIGLDVRTDPAAGSIRIDPRHLERLLIAAARLVRAFAQEGGSKRCSVDTLRRGGEVLLRFGVPEARLARAVDVAPAEVEAVAELADRSGGRMGWEEEGGALLVRFPALIGEQELAGPLPVADTGRTTVWVVEDDEAVRHVVCSILTRAGYRVLAAEDGAEALELSRSGEQVDLLVTDVRMPGMNGLELYERLVAGRPRIRVLFMSGLVEDATLRETLSDPNLDFLQKPFTASELLEKVRTTLQPVNPDGRSRVLVVDDEPGVLELVRDLLADRHYECAVASSAALALRMLRDRTYELVLCDMVMPDRDGLELLRAIRRDFPAVRVVGMSGHPTRRSTLAAARELGAVRTLHKPFSRDDLLVALDEACGRETAA